MKESIEQFLARGGQITKAEYKAPEVAENVVRPTGGGPNRLMDLAEGAHFFAEKRTTKKSKKADA